MAYKNRQDLTDLTGETVHSNDGLMLAQKDHENVNIFISDEETRILHIGSNIREMVWSTNGEFIAIIQQWDTSPFKMISVFKIKTEYSFFSEKYHVIKNLKQWGCNNFTFCNEDNQLIYLGPHLSKFHNMTTYFDSKTMDPCITCHSTNGCNTGERPIYSDSESAYEDDDDD